MFDKDKIEKEYTHPFSFKVSDTKDAAIIILTSVIRHYLKSSDGFSVDINFDGDYLRTKSFFQKVTNKIKEDLPEINKVTQAYYDVIVDLYIDDSNKKVASFNNEITVSECDIGYKVDGKNTGKHWHDINKVSRYATLDYPNIPKKPNEIEASPFYVGNFASVTADDMKNFDPKTFDPNTIKNPRGVGYYGRDTFKPRTRTYIDPRFANLDLENRNTMLRRKIRRNEAQLSLIQNQELDNTELQNTTATQKLGKQSIVVPISKSIMNAVDKMSYQTAYDAVEDAKKAWEDADSYEQYKDTLNLSEKWYGMGARTISGNSFQEIFKVMDDIYEAGDLVKKVRDLDDKIANTKSRTAITKLRKERDEADAKLKNLTDSLSDTLHNAPNNEDIEKLENEMNKNIKDYIKDLRQNISDWKTVNAKVKKMGKLVETLDALRQKYTSNRNDLPALMPRYKALVEQPAPYIIDIESLDKVNLDIVKNAWRTTMEQYRENLEDFDKAFMLSYNALAPMLAVKAKSRSLF